MVGLWPPISSRDLVPVCTHDPWLHLLTDIPAHPDLAGLQRHLEPRVVAAFTWPPPSASSWWVWDLTWEQVAALRVRRQEPTMDRWGEGGWQGRPHGLHGLLHTKDRVAGDETDQNTHIYM